MLRSLPAAVTVLMCAAASLLLNVRGASAVKIVTFVGQTVILPCGVQVGRDKNVLNVEWTKKDGTKHGAIAFLYRDGCETLDKHDNFTLRSQLFLKELKVGNMSLRLSDVRRSDAGTYTCTRRDDSAGDTCTVELSVGASSEPTLAMVPGEAVTLQCEASCWFPKPDVTFLDAEGNVISGEEPKFSQDPQSDCYSVTRRATVQAGNNFTCRVNQSEIDQTRKTEIHIPDREPVFGLDYGSGNQSPGAGFQGRVSVPPQWKTTGNLTMTLKGATTGDEGVYWFYVQHENTSALKEKLCAVRLKVKKRVPDPTPRSPVVPENQIRTPEAVYIAIAFLGGVAMGVVGCKAYSSLLRYLKTRRSRACGRPDVASHPDAGAQLLNGNSAGQMPLESKV